MASAARRQIIGGGAPMNKSRRRRRPQILGGGGATRPAHDSTYKYATYNLFLDTANQPAAVSLRLHVCTMSGTFWINTHQ